MKELTLLFDEKLTKEVEEKVLPLLKGHLKAKVPFGNELNLNLLKDDLVVTYLSDKKLKLLVPLAISQGWTMAFLPHPEMVHGRQGFGIGANLEKSVKHILESESSKQIDVLLVNGDPVINTVIIGESMGVMYGIAELSWLKQFLEKVKNLFGMLKRVFLHPYTIVIPQEETENAEKESKKSEINTAALGMVIVQHGRSSLLRRRVLEDSFVDDGMMHNLVLAPQSVMSLIGFGLKSFFRSSKNPKLPSFVAHIRTRKMKISSQETMGYTVDGVSQNAQEIELEVKNKALQIIPGRYLETEAKANNKEVFKTQLLPRGEAKEELLKGPLPYIYHATTEEFKDLFTQLRENSVPKSSYLVLMVLSTLIATLGLFSDSSPVIIGAMILAPLMAPIISLSMGVLRQDKRLTLNSLKTVGLGLLLGYIFAVLLTRLTPLNILNEEITARIRPNLLDLGVAAVSGVAGAYAHSKKEIAKTLAGVAIAVALVPPLAVSGIGLGWGDWAVFSGALLLLVTNLAGMILAAALTFLLLGFSPFRLARKGLVWSFFLVVGVSAPLALGFSEMVRENKLLKNLSGYHIEEDVTLRNVKIRSLQPISISLTIISEHALKEGELERIKKEIEGLVGEEVILEVTIGVKMK
ncbi:DUF389 domain-containing protein [Echinicola sp. 20G]|uniref:DUF389 domain-containing protein n=1 Tax=Echinicola sp. 20G TaxID=2781961 RepID=UPI001910C51D|nr:DUF389 domain-containing protein [Echinicola sp. 20G]